MKAIEEINNPMFELTKQYLKVNELIYKNNEPEIEEIVIDEKEECAEVYFPIKNEKFYFKIYIDLKPSIKVRFMDMSPGNIVSLLIISEKISMHKIIEAINNNVFEKWNKGDVVANRKKKTYEENSGVIYRPIIKRTGNVEDKIELILNNLSASKNSIKEIEEYCTMEIQVAYFGYRDEMWGINLNSKLIKKISDFGFSIDVDLYAGGKELEEIDI